MNSDKINKWAESDSDDDYDEGEEYQNEIASPQLDEQFIKNVLAIKESLYKDIILSPPLETKDAQDIKLIEIYIIELNNVLNLTNKAKKGKIDETTLTKYTPQTQEQIKKILVWASTFFNNKHINDTTPYEHYIYTMFHTYPFLQH
jgi:hypothetical protein